MKLFTFPPAPNPSKLHLYLREKGIEIPQVMVNLVHGEQHKPEFRAVNPLGGVPVLELDDGSHLRESLAIIEYLEELHPDPPMIGRDALERARVRSLERTIDLGVLIRTARIVHATRSPLPGVEPSPEVARSERERLDEVLAVLDEEIGDRPFVAGGMPTIADCTLFAGVRFGAAFGVEPQGFPNLERWRRGFGARPSAQG
jgi:glutathione S-transferase